MELDELPPLCAVKRESGLEAPPLHIIKTEPGEERPRGRGVTGSEDHLVGPDMDAFEAALVECTVRDQEEVDVHRRRDEEINALLYEQALAAAREFNAKQAGWRHKDEE